MSDTAVHHDDGDDATATQRSRRHKHKHHHHRHTRTHGDDNATRDEAAASPTSGQQPDDTHERQDTPAANNNNESKNEHEDWEANRLQLEQLSALPENKMCSDCNDSGTRWASVNHGVFVCIRCAGVHRALGTHVSKVKSTTMDRWKACEVRLMAAIGNTRGKAMYEARLSTAEEGDSNNNGSSGGGGDGGSAATRMTSSASDAQLRAFVERKYAHYAFACDNVRRLLRRVHRQVGYHVKAARSASTGDTSTTRTHTTAAAAATETTTTADDPATAVKVDNKSSEAKSKSTTTRISRTAMMKAFYGDDVTAAAKAAAAAAKATQATSSSNSSSTTRAKTVHGTFGVVNVPTDEYASRLQHLLDAFAVT